MESFKTGKKCNKYGIIASTMNSELVRKIIHAYWLKVKTYLTQPLVIQKKTEKEWLKLCFRVSQYQLFICQYKLSYPYIHLEKQRGLYWMQGTESLTQFQFMKDTVLPMQLRETTSQAAIWPNIWKSCWGKSG